MPIRWVEQAVVQQALHQDEECKEIRFATKLPLPDYPFWLKMDGWTSQESAYLLAKIDPWLNSLLSHCLANKHLYPCDAVLKELESLREISFLIGRADFVQELSPSKTDKSIAVYSPYEVLLWADNRGLEIPSELKSARSEARKEKLANRPIQDSGKPLVQCQLDKQLVKAIAKTLLQEDPTIKIVTLTNHQAILEYGHGEDYTGRNTLRDWISEARREFTQTLQE